uniref:Lysine-specific demethylase JMJD5-1 n=1 Tax=Brachionus koreanus TaxID=1199090 RepID=A0A513TZJ0_9BILA|nr:lysine-specific demethylase JMJD5-1 [Brachionus koreanus]
MLMNYLLILLVCLVGNQCSETANHPGHLKPFGSSGPYLQIETVNDLPTKIFFSNYVKPKRAVLMKNFVNQFPAFVKWNDQYLNDNSYTSPDYKVLLETSKKETRNQETISLPLHDFLLIYNTSQLYMVNEVPPYIKKDVVLPQPLQCAQAPSVLEETIMWFSSGGTSSVTHTDDYENILCVFDGIKELVLVDYFKHKKAADMIIDQHKGAYSSMDVDKVDYEKFPLIKELEYYRFNLSAGDCLYIPYKWVHQVRSYGRNLAINFWFNYERIFGNDEFGQECSENKLDLSKTLDTLTYGPVEDNFFYNFKIFIMRQVNLGNRKIDQWISLVLGEKELNDEKKELSIEMLNEMFSLMDFDGNGLLSDDEVIDLNENSIEHILGILNEVESIIYEDSDQNEDPEDEDELDEENLREEL